MDLNLGGAITKRAILTLLVVMTALLYIPASASSMNPRKTLVAYCTNLSTPSSPPTGIPTNLTFACGSNPAFTATQATISIPAYSLPQGYGAIYVKGSATLKLSSGVSTSLTPGNYTYIALYDGSAISMLASFSVTWSSK